MATPKILATLPLTPRYILSAFQTRWGWVEFHLEDLMVEDPQTGLPLLVAQDETLAEARRGFYPPPSDVALFLLKAAQAATIRKVEDHLLSLAHYQGLDAETMREVMAEARQ